jgi:hypothetical protein
VGGRHAREDGVENEIVVTRATRHAKFVFVCVFRVLPTWSIGENCIKVRVLLAVREST